VAGMMDLLTLERHDQAFQIGEPTAHFYVLLEGPVKIYRRRRVGRQVTLAILKPGDVFGEDALTADGEHEQGVLRPQRRHRVLFRTPQTPRIPCASLYARRDARAPGYGACLATAMTQAADGIVMTDAHGTVQ
jgi:CRP-like cAMP-binding protein